MTDLDLFGDPILAQAPRARKTGYIAQPGTGPAGETCKSCEHYCRLGGHAKVYLKCGLMRDRWTNGAGTDIKARSPACSKWEAPSDG